MKEKVAPEVISGKKIIALAITEPQAGSDVSNITTTAVRDVRINEKCRCWLFREIIMLLVGKRSLLLLAWKLITSLLLLAQGLTEWAEYLWSL